MWEPCKKSVLTLEEVRIDSSRCQYDQILHAAFCFGHTAFVKVTYYSSLISFPQAAFCRRTGRGCVPTARFVVARATRTLPLPSFYFPLTLTGATGISWGSFDKRCRKCWPRLELVRKNQGTHPSEKGDKLKRYDELSVN